MEEGLGESVKRNRDHAVRVEYEWAWSVRRWLNCATVIEPTPVIDQRTNINEGTISDGKTNSFA